MTATKGANCRPRELRCLPAGAFYGAATGIVVGAVAAAIFSILPAGETDVATLAGILRLVAGVALAGTAVGALIGLGLGEGPRRARDRADSEKSRAITRPNELPTLRHNG